MKLVIKIAAILSIIIGGRLCRGDSWASPVTFINISENKKYLAYVEPVSETLNRKTPLLKVYKINDINSKKKEYDPNNTDEKVRLTFWKEQVKLWEDGKQITFIWEQNLSNSVSPIETFISDDGKYVVTLDNWFGLGRGDDVIAFYKKGGQIKKYSLEQALSVKVKDDWDWRKMFSVSILSLNWNEDSIVFLSQVNNKLLFCIWLEWDYKWLAFDVANGDKIKIDQKLKNQINQSARKVALQNIKNESSMYNGIAASCLLLARMRIPEDRKVIESVLSDKNFSSGAVTSEGVKRPYSESYYRKAADTALSIWDKKLPDNTKYKWMEDVLYKYLGNVTGKVILPEMPKEKSILWLYIIQDDVFVNKWSKDDIAQYLNESFDDNTFFKLEPSKSTSFEFRGVMPGTYWLKAVYEVESSGDNEVPGKTHIPKKGDFENIKSSVFEVKAGQTIDVGTIDCNSPVKE
jgi:hypothetical protein